MKREDFNNLPVAGMIALARDNPDRRAAATAGIGVGLLVSISPSDPGGPSIVRWGVDCGIHLAHAGKSTRTLASTGLVRGSGPGVTSAEARQTFRRAIDGASGPCTATILGAT